VNNVVKLASPAGGRPEPMTPEGANMRGMPWMPLDIDRLRRSKTWLLNRRRPEIAFYQINLWMKSWHEVPAASFEDDDDVLADAAMCSPEAWPEVREAVLRGWVLCSDGRLYHPVVAEKVREAIALGDERRERTAKARAKRQDQAGGKSSVTEVVADTVTDIVTEVATEAVTETVTSSVEPLSQALHLQVQSTEGSKKESKFTKPKAALCASDDAPSPSRAVCADRELPSARDVLWRDGVPILQHLTGKPEKGCRRFLGKLLAAARDDCQAVLMAVLEARETRPADVGGWLAARFGVKQGATGGQQAGRGDYLFDALLARGAGYDPADGADPLGYDFDAAPECGA
jgi:hypothetical protein